MAKAVIHDWIVQVGFDDSLPRKGMKNLEKMFSRLDRVQQRTLSNAVRREQRGRIENSRLAQKLIREEHQAAEKSFKNKQSKEERLRRESARNVARKNLEHLGPSPKTLKAEKTLLAERLMAEEKIARKRIQNEKLIREEQKKNFNEAINRLGPQKSGGESLRQQLLKQETRAAIKEQRIAQQQELARTKMRNRIDAVVRRAEFSLPFGGEEFESVRKQAKILKDSLENVKTPKQFEAINNQLRVMRENVIATSAVHRKLTNHMNAQKFAAQGLRNSIHNLARSYISVFAAIEGARVTFQTGREFDSLNASLLAASGSAEQAAKDFEFIKDISVRLGVELGKAADGWRQIGAAGRFSSLITEQTKNVFLAATEASRAFGLSAERTGLVYLAFSQILSKGKVSQEELRRQLGEQLPGVMAIAAKAMKVTTAQLEEMIKKGISAEEFLPRFSAELRKSVTESGALAASLRSITAAQQRFNSAIQLSIVESFNRGGKKGVVFFFNQMSEVVKGLAPLFRNLGRVIGSVGFVFSSLLRVVTLIPRTLQTVVDAVGMFTESLFSLNKEGDVGFLNLMEKQLKRLAAALLLPIALLERFLNVYEKLRDKINFLNPVKALGAVGIETIKSVKREFSGPKERDLTPSKLTENRTINSGNTLNLTIQGVDTANTQDVRSVINQWWNETMEIAQ